MIKCTIKGCKKDGCFPFDEVWPTTFLSLHDAKAFIEEEIWHSYSEDWDSESPDFIEWSFKEGRHIGSFWWDGYIYNVTLEDE